MASENRASSEAVDFVTALESAPYKFNFYQALRLIEARNPDMDRVGRAKRPSGEAVRLGQEPSLIFAPSMLAEFRRGGKNAPDHLVNFFFGLFGPNGALPLHLTEFARDRERLHRDATFRGFADIFHHRMISLFYRAWAEARPAVQMDRPHDDGFSRYVGALFGIGLGSLRNRDALSDHAKLYMAGRLALQTRPAGGMQAMLEELFRVPMRVEQYVGEWMELPAASRFLLGKSPDTGTLGVTASLGARVWGSQHKFRISCGPLGNKDFARFLPGAQSLHKLCATVRNYVGDELEWELRLLLMGSEVPNVVLGKQGQLGWTSWIGEKKPESVTDDVVLRPAELAVELERGRQSVPAAA